MLLHLARGLLAASALAGSVAAAGAATAHNSQAGSWGPTTHNCAPTPYFPAGGCASAALQDDRRYPFVIPAEPYDGYRPGRRLTYPGYPGYSGAPFDD